MNREKGKNHKMPKRIVFNENDEPFSCVKDNKTKKQFSKIKTNLSSAMDVNDDNMHWYKKFADYNTNEEISEIKESELTELRNLCKTKFNNEAPSFAKKNAHDYKWLQTALLKGTASDKNNAGAVLVQTNPLGNMAALSTLIEFTKSSNKFNSEAITIVSQLFIETLLPPDRKLISFQLRGSDWKNLKKQNISDEVKSQIYAHWYYENELKDYYFDFLKNIQNAFQTGKDHIKGLCIISAAKLLIFSPEKEQMLLSMLINKLGDPSNKVASKALYHLIEVATAHPNMSGVIVSEAEKLLFRNNISERAQHFALCFLAQITSNADFNICTKLVNICFSYFKILVQKGAVNNRTMQAILRCLQRSINKTDLTKNNESILTKDMQDTIYRLVHLADIQISIQTLSLLLQLVIAKVEQPDRFYNALYKKLIDLNLVTVGNKTASQILHIFHRAIYADSNITRAKALIKRLLQLSLYMPAQVSCGCLIVVNKLIKTKPELIKSEKVNNYIDNISDIDLIKFDSDGDEKYEDICSDTENLEEKIKINEDNKIKSSWIHSENIQKNNKQNDKIKEISKINYDPYSRNPEFAGAEFSEMYELILLSDHFHPSAKVFANDIINGKQHDYYGDPLRDFSLSHFLERFCFKNPKKFDANKDNSISANFQMKRYIPRGSRGQSVHSLTKDNCTEEEIFIFNYLEKKREKQIINKKNEDDDDVESVNDDEFDNYLDSLCKKSKIEEDIEEDDYELDFLKELKQTENCTKTTNKNKIRKESIENKKDDEIDDEEIFNASDEENDNLFDDFDNEADDNEDDFESDDNLSNDNNSNYGSEDDMESLNDNLDDMNSEDDNSLLNEQIFGPKKKRSKTNFGSSLKNTNDLQSLFVAADDFAEMLEETGKTKGHGTINAVFNQDKSNEKQLNWEEKRHKSFKRKKFSKFNKTTNKRKH